MKNPTNVQEAYGLGMGAHMDGKKGPAIADPLLRKWSQEREPGDPATEFEKRAWEIGWKDHQSKMNYKRLLKEAEAYEAQRKKPGPKKEPG